MAKYSFTSILDYYIVTTVPPTDEAFSGQYGFRLVAHQGLTRSKLMLLHHREDEKLANGILQIADDYGDYWIHEIKVENDDQSIVLGYWKGGNRIDQAILCRPFPGLRLEFEALCLSTHIDHIVIEWPSDPDPIFGRILRIWEHRKGHTDILTVLEDGRIIGVTDDNATHEAWSETQVESMRCEIESYDEDHE